MKRINIQFLGQRVYIANDVEQAKKMAESDLQHVSSNLNIGVNGHMVLGEIGEEE